MTKHYDRHALVARARAANRQEIEDLQEELAATSAIVDSLLDELGSLERHESRLLDRLAEHRADRTPPSLGPDIGAQLHEYRRRNR